MLEGPVFVGAQVVDSQHAVLQTDFAEPLPVESERRNPLQPGHEGDEAIRAARVCGSLRCGRIALRRHRCGAGLAGGNSGRCLHDCRGHSKRTPLGAGGHRNLPVRLDADRQFGTDQAHPLGTDLPAHQTSARNRYLGLGGARHHRAIGIAHLHVEDADSGAAGIVALDLGAGYRDLVGLPDILFDRGSEPGRQEVEFDRARRQPQPQPGASQEDHRESRADADREFAHLGPPRRPPDTQPQPQRARAQVAAARRAMFPKCVLERAQLVQARHAFRFGHARSDIPLSVKPKALAPPDWLT